jgi:hypothetical protein
MQHQQCPAPAAYHATRLQTPLAGCVGHLQLLTRKAAAHAGVPPVWRHPNPTGRGAHPTHTPIKPLVTHPMYTCRLDNHQGARPAARQLGAAQSASQQDALRLTSLSQLHCLLPSGTTSSPELAKSPSSPTCCTLQADRWQRQHAHVAPQAVSYAHRLCSYSEPHPQTARPTMPSTGPVE